jgi:hypothetical protein
MCVKKLRFDCCNPHNFETRKGEVVGDKISFGENFSASCRIKPNLKIHIF